ncbi:hypothetical protein PR048_031885 [Dryococelus australis]|uniref:RNA-directed DNA polymerase n=1 Tax=Dryococelus australis TaxID=614101 RepID=A0ABQ9G971_9NEOP|nr:hypothetical protein PR048_031885 [Dryococelus australis]
MPRRGDKKAVMHLLGMYKYLSKFIPTFSECTAHLRNLTRNDVAVSWAPEHEMEFAQVKKFAFVVGPEMSIAGALSLTHLTDEETDLSYALLAVHNRWPVKEKVPQSLKSYFSIENCLSEAEGLFSFEDMVIVPKSLVPTMRNLVHECHFGVTKTKQRAHQCLFWLGMGADIENFSGTFDVWVSLPCNNKKEPLPWEIVGCDLIWFGGHHYLVSYVDNSSSSSVVNKLNYIFARLGVPDVLVSDNITFGSSEFAKFSKEWNFKLVLTSPRHSQSNGLAEKGVGIAKNILRRIYEWSLCELCIIGVP